MLYPHNVDQTNVKEISLCFGISHFQTLHTIFQFIFLITNFWTQPMSISRGMEKNTVAPTDSRVLFRQKKVANSVIFDNMDDDGTHYSK